MAPAQEISPPLPGTPNPAGSVVPPTDADGVPDTLPDGESERAAPNVVAPEVDRERAAGAAAQTTPMTAADLQKWQQIATLHEQFVRSHIPGAENSQTVARTDPNRERLRQLWERLARIERQLIVTGAFNESPPVVAVTARPITRPRGTDLDEIPDPLTATNQKVPASETDRDQNTARSLVQEDRSPVPDPVAPGVVVRDVPPSEVERTPVEVVVPAAAAVPRAATRAAVSGNLWNEFFEIRRQILIAEIAAAQSIADE